MSAGTWNRDPPPDFQGLREDVPVTFYRRHLPHWRQDGAHYFVTFRLADALPQSKLRELEAIAREFAANHGVRWADVQYGQKCQGQAISSKAWESFARDSMQRVEKWLDQGMGSCVLRRREIANIVADALHHFDEVRYELGGYVIMPNHVHLVIRPLLPNSHPLEKILQSRKRRTSQEINAVLQRAGTLWQEESFDRIVRDEEHLYRCIQYIGDNPRRAGLPVVGSIRWVRPQWRKLGWGFADL